MQAESIDLPAAGNLSADDTLRLVFPGDTELARRCREFDWARSPLGPVHDWPRELQTVVRACLESPFPINLWCGDDLVLIYNDGYCRLLGGKHPAALGRPGPQVWAEIWDRTEPMFDQVRAGGPAVYAEDQEFVIERAGERETVWFTFGLSAIRDGDGAIIAYLNIASETTQQVLARSRATEALGAAERAEARLRDVFAQAPVGVAVLRGPDHVYDLVNPLYQRFLPGRALLGLPIREALPELAGQGVFEILDRVLTTGEPATASEYSIVVDRSGTGTMVAAVFNFVYQPVRDALGTVSSIVVIATDVTELVEARHAAETARLAAEDANAAKAQFLATMSHELRTPLNAIGGYAQLMAMGVHGPVTPKQTDALERIRRSQEHLLGLINNVLNYAKLEAGKVSYDIADVDLVSACAEVEALVAPQARMKGITLERSCQLDAVKVRSDAEKLRQIMLNLLSNAVKFTDHGRVELGCHLRDDGRTAAIEVSDTGRGIPPDQLSRIFDPFVQVGRRLSSSDEGTGLGLAISRDLALGMGGDLVATSIEGVGSTFTLTIPVATPDAR